MKARFFGKINEAAGVKTFVFKPEQRLDYKAGQFAFFNFEYEGKAHSKHFTLSDSPLKPNLELTTVMSDSDYKRALDRLEIGHVVDIEGPHGDFTLDRAGTRKLVFLVGGIGITPVRSMLQYMADKGFSRPITLFYSNQSPERIAFKEELWRMDVRVKGLKVVHALSELTEKTRGLWSGEIGRIDREMVERNEEDVQRAVFFVAGPPGFVDGMERMLGEIGIPQERIVSERFPGY